MSLILALPTKQRVRETVVCTAVASAVSAIACIATTASTVQAVAQPSASSARVVSHDTALQAVSAPSARYNLVSNHTVACQAVAIPLSSVNVMANYSAIATAVAQPSARYALIDATGEVGVCSTVASISATSNRIVSHSLPVGTVAAAPAVYRVAAGTTSAVSAVADVTSPVSRQVNHTTPAQAVAKPFIEQGSLRYIIITIAQEEARFDMVEKCEEFRISATDIEIKGVDSVTIDTTIPTRNFVTDPEEKPFGV